MASACLTSSRETAPPRSARNRSATAWSKSSPPRRGIAAGGQHLEHALLEAQQRKIERAAAKVVDREQPFGLAVQTVGEGRRRRFGDETQHVEPGEAGGIARGSARRVVEIGGHGHDRAVDVASECQFCAFLDRAQDVGADFDRCQQAVADLQACHAAFGGGPELVGKLAAELLQGRPRPGPSAA